MSENKGPQIEYILEQYKALRTESIERFRHDRTIQRNGLLVIAAAYSFLFGVEINADVKLNPILVQIMFFLPPLVAGYTGLQQYRIKRQMDRIGKFCLGFEKFFFSDNDLKKLGWEHFIHAQRREEAGLPESDNTDDFLAITKRKRIGSANYLETRFWAGLFLATTALAFAMLIFPFEIIHP